MKEHGQLVDSWLICRKPSNFWGGVILFSYFFLTMILVLSRRFDNYIKYVHQLTELHVAFGNLAEAGKTLLLHAKVIILLKIIY